ncbi:hypothetical protein PIB30_091505 [Stylosanthes scabra]|uniref:Uncharacterized protein n=1 Tax=Stylosanthes scabra TaxID=79078 RepID=A0ABU6ZT88_9FABA|nr:hypothetical protein [Stylosanthes scabra]
MDSRQAWESLPSSRTSHVWPMSLDMAKRDSPKLTTQGHGNKDKQILNFDPEIERTLRKLRKQSKQAQEGSSAEVIEEVFDNMAAEGTQEKIAPSKWVTTCGLAWIARKNGRVGPAKL